jgi:hypothetical protein
MSDTNWQLTAASAFTYPTGVAGHINVISALSLQRKIVKSQRNTTTVPPVGNMAEPGGR